MNKISFIYFTHNSEVGQEAESATRYRANNLKVSIQRAA